MADLKIIETGDGGDVIFNGVDLVTVEGLQNMPYLAMFGGNPGAPTTGPNSPNIEAFDYLGNFVLNPNTPPVWFNSLLEDFLTKTALTPAALGRIENIVKADLDFMNDFATINVRASLPGVDRLQINILVIELNSQNENEFSYIWDATKNELFFGEKITGKQTGAGIGLPVVLNYDL